MEEKFEKDYLQSIGLCFLFVASMLVGCASSKSQKEDGRGPEREQTVHVYDADELPGTAYEKIREVISVGCKGDVYAPSPNREEIVSELKRQAEQQGGDALINVVCRRGANAEDCAGALRCTGDAVRVVSVESLPQIAQRVRSNQVGEDETRRGTGWVTSSELVATSYQLVRGRSDFALSMPDTTLSARVVASDEAHNIALLRPSRPSLLPPPLPWAPGAETGERVFTVGYPSFETGDAGVRTSTGIVSAQSGILGDARVYRTTFSLPFERGGAPLLNYRGEVVGMLISPSTTQGFPQSSSASDSFSYAVKNTYLQQLQTRLKNLSDSLRTPAEEGRYVQQESSLPLLLEKVVPSVLGVTAR